MELIIYTDLKLIDYKEGGTGEETKNTVSTATLFFMNKESKIICIEYTNFSEVLIQ